MNHVTPPGDCESNVGVVDMSAPLKMHMICTKSMHVYAGDKAVPCPVAPKLD